MLLPETEQGGGDRCALPDLGQPEAALAVHGLQRHHFLHPHIGTQRRPQV